MIIEIEKIFKTKNIDEIKLLEYGFLKRGNDFIKSISILNNQFNFFVTINLDGEINYKVIDNTTMEEYFLIKLSSARGKFVENMRAVCREILIEIFEKCFSKDNSNGEQTKKVISFIKEKYDVNPEHLFEKSPEVAVFRKKESKKWFCVLMRLKGKKLNLDEESVEIINIKAPPQVVEKLLLRENIYPAYHMNKKHWVTLCLNKEILDREIFDLILQSYECSRK